MLKRLIAVLSLVPGIAAASAQPVDYRFEWRGFMSGDTWVPDATIFGTFTASDSNGDHIIAADELSAFALNYAGWPDPWPIVGCPEGGPGVGFLTDCTLYQFQYRQGGKLAFVVDARWSFEGSTYASMHWDAPHAFTSWTVDPPTGGSYTLQWTAATQFTISPLLVPEPSGWLLLSAGLPIAARRLRRRS